MVEIPATPQPTVDAIFAALEAEDRAKPVYEGYGVSVSALGTDCDRKLFLDLRWASAPEVVDGRKLSIFARGNEVEDRIVGYLRKAGLEVEDVDPATGKQWRLSLARGFLRGKADGTCIGVLEAPKARHVIEIKCLKAADWRAIRKHGLLAKKPEHWHQLHAGMAALGVDRGLYIAENADTRELLTERLHLDIEEANRQVARVERLVDAHDAPLGLLGNVSTEKQAEKQRATPPCRFCPHDGFCFDKTFVRRTCRSCLHFTFTEDGNGECARFERPLKPAEQRDGSECPAHLYLPTLVSGVQVDADPERETITYNMPDGSRWTDGDHGEI